jgi:hypothetical protein
MFFFNFFFSFCFNLQLAGLFPETFELCAFPPWVMFFPTFLITILLFGFLFENKKSVLFSAVLACVSMVYDDYDNQ